MRERIGIILGITGVILLLAPSIDYQQFESYFLFALKNYWPIGLIVVGMILMNPKNKKRSRY